MRIQQPITKGQFSRLSQERITQLMSCSEKFPANILRQYRKLFTEHNEL